MKNLSPDLLQVLIASIKKFKLKSVSEEIINKSSKCLSILPIGKDSYSSIGNSRFGGEPDLPKYIQWPKAPKEEGIGTRFGNFIAQINFAEFSAFSKDYELPQKGILYIFVMYMECAGDAVKIESVFYEGDLSNLERRASPIRTFSIGDGLNLDTAEEDFSWLLEDKEPLDDAMCVDFLSDLIPIRIDLVPSISIAIYCKDFKKVIEEKTAELKGKNGLQRLRVLIDGLKLKNQIGQFLGFANSNDEVSNLYQNVALEQLGKRYEYVTFWNSMEEYEADIQEQKNSQSNLFEYYKKMRKGVKSFLKNKENVKILENEWQLLFRLDSNFFMKFFVMDNDPFYIFIRKTDLMQKNFSNLSGEVTQG